MLVRLDLNGSPFLGVYCCASDARVLLPPNLPEGFVRQAREAMEVPLSELTIGGSSVLGALVSMNARGAVVSDLAYDEERHALEQAGLVVEVLPAPANAAGNLVVANDQGCLVAPDVSARSRARIERALGVPATVGTLAGLSTVGSAAVATNRGVLVHPKATDEELAVIEEALGVRAKHCTVNHGSPYLGAGLVVNAKGAMIGGATTGPEMARVEDGLGFLD